MNLSQSISWLTIILCLLGSTLYSNDNNCNSYLESDNPIQTLNDLKADSTPEAQFCVGAMYFKGIGTEANETISFEWVKKAAEQGFAPAQSNVGAMYILGTGVDANENAAVLWYQKAAIQDHSLAQCALGTLYYEGKGVGQDYIEALKWLTKAKGAGCQKANIVLNKKMSVINWKKSNESFSAELMLYDQNGTYYPNEASMQSGKYLIVKENEEVYVALYFISCQKNSKGLCTETVDTAIYMPDWSLVGEIKNTNLLKSHPAEPGEQLQHSDYRLFLNMEKGDPKGIYHILVTIYDAHHNPKMTLNQQYLLE